MRTLTKLGKGPLVILFLIITVAIYMGCSSEEAAQTEDTSAKQTTAGRTVEKAQQVAQALSNPKPSLDPVCAMAIDENAVVITHNDKEYGFCSQHCAEAFQEDPDKYLVATGETGHEGNDNN